MAPEEIGFVQKYLELADIAFRQDSFVDRKPEAA
jgi:hypothetical protein